MELWTPDKSLSELPEDIRIIYVEHARILLDKLKTYKNERRVIGGNNPLDPDYKRKGFTNINPRWYSKLYWSIPNFRRDRSEKALIRIIEGKDRKYNGWSYHFDKIYREYIHEEQLLPINDDIREYFNLKRIKRSILEEHKLEEEPINYEAEYPF